MVDRVSGGVGEVENAIGSVRSARRRWNVGILNGKRVEIFARARFHTHRRPDVEIDRTHQFVSGHEQISGAHRQPAAYRAVNLQVCLFRVRRAQVTVNRGTTLEKRRV